MLHILHSLSNNYLFLLISATIQFIMKKFLLPLAFVLMCIVANAQRGKQIYYYYKGQKVFFPVSNDRLVVGIQPGSFSSLKARVASLAGIAADSIIQTQRGKQLLVKLGRNNKRDISPIVAA